MAAGAGAGVRVIDDAEVLKALFTPLRLRLLGLLERPLTAKQLADELGVPVNRLYYHLRVLQQHGFVEEAGKRPGQRLPETVFRACSQKITVSNDLVPSPALARGAIGAIFDSVRASLGDVLESELRGTRTISVGQTAGRLSPQEFAAFRDRLHALLEELEGADSDDPEARTYQLLAVLFPGEGR